MLCWLVQESKCSHSVSCQLTLLQQLSAPYPNTDMCTVGIVNLLEAFPLPTIEAYICAEETHKKYVACACKPLAISEKCFTKHPLRTAEFKAP